MNIEISDTAANRISQLLEHENSKETLRFRISVFGGGCSGFQYNFTLDSAMNTDDHLFEKNGIYVVIDEVSLGILAGSQIDFVEELGSSTFVMKNPNAASSCGCGNSFSL
ncbi:MAG: iron-sulfur cluster insertion protein ErpA [Alphaproteobacteria bacterium]|jgi:iron-sulfur cluster insertion protein|nr:iron-sulfur cluster insertion protein ErpA [Alphaproteobacteria bacterium]